MNIITKQKLSNCTMQVKNQNQNNTAVMYQVISSRWIKTEMSMSEAGPRQVDSSIQDKLSSKTNRHSQ